MTGDRRAVGLRIGAEPGFASDEVLADLLPAGKVRLVGDLAPRGKVAFVGDGVNDAAARRCRHHHGCDGQRGRASGRRHYYPRIWAGWPRRTGWPVGRDGWSGRT